MTSLRQRMIRDMNLAGFTAGTQRAYIHGVRQLAKHYGLPPDQLSEKQVEDYVFYLREEKKVAKGTFQEYFHASASCSSTRLTAIGRCSRKKSTSAPPEASARHLQP